MRNPPLQQGWKKLGFLEKVFNFLVFFRFRFLKSVFRFLGLMDEERTHNYDPEIHEEYLIHNTPIPCHIIYSHVQIIAWL